MNYKKIILVGFISAFVAVLTSVLGVAGTVIGSVISSMLYNMLSEALEEPVSTAKFSTNFEWEIAYIFPLAVIALIQLLLIFAMLSEFGILPTTFLNAYLSLQNLANNNLYRILGIAMIIISVYPLVLKPDIIKKAHGVIIAFVGLIFLARGFVDLGNAITDIYDDVFIVFDFPIAVLALILILFVIIRILMSAKDSEKEFRIIKHNDNENFAHNVKKVHHSKKHTDFDYDKKMEEIRTKRYHRPKRPNANSEVQSQDQSVDEKHDAGINKSSGNIQFESNDLLDDYRK
ncbi:MAG: YihY/virulence factor BrkB family protein [Methanobrevibacter thaueri]|uniref:YihY/virulence factor BrkB family protein n=1 Tax=Methanobrevibacter thaueri TaxID=190975 RepID=A0A8T3VB78_9EURY|nr:hypothetical protein [Methanobrevibacter thaueri]MBE6501207.1 YihY/virulence factor BrkB family protein [Methanobrevibacter thaueri]